MQGGVTRPGVGRWFCRRTGIDGRRRRASVVEPEGPGARRRQRAVSTSWGQQLPWSNEREAATRVGGSRGELAGTAMVPLRLFLGRLVCGSVQRRSRSERLMTERDRFILNGRLGTRLVVLRRVVVTAAPSVERLGVRIRVRVSLTPQNLSLAGWQAGPLKRDRTVSELDPG